MIQIQQDYSLQELNTLAVDAQAECFFQALDAESLVAASNWADQHDKPLTIIGGGSNLLLSATIPGLVVQNAITGIRIMTDGDQFIVFEVGAGENWHQFVLKSLLMGASGLENLSLIPGTVGAAPVQNIGAYGVEMKDHFLGLTAWDRKIKRWLELNKDDCQFNYRDSIFKQNPGRYLISQVRFKLPKSFNPVLDYGPLSALKQQIDGLTPMTLSEHICQLRMSKLPNPKEIPNAGSFFKNPVVSAAQHEKLLKQYPNLVSYPVSDEFKLAAGWLIDQAGLKGYRDPDSHVGTHSQQALVLVNPSKADAKAVMSVVEFICQTVFDRFQVQLEMEPVQVPAC